MMRRPSSLVFAILLLSYGYFWHGRDWNISSRLMLTYAVADRATIRIDGLEDHTGDRARFRGHFYSDKMPGYSLLAVGPYVLAKTSLGLPDHPLERKGMGFTHWPADYWITLGTSALLTALCGAILTEIALELGCGPRRALLVGLIYGLSTPAHVYATLAYGHQAAAFFLFLGFFATRRLALSNRSKSWTFLCGFSLAMAVWIELQVAPVSAVISGAVFIDCVRGRLAKSLLIWGILGAFLPIAALFLYNVAAFGSPFDMGYFHEDLAQFQKVHNADNPLGLRRFDLSKSADLLWGEHRGLLLFAPILILAPLGWGVLIYRSRWRDLIVTLGACFVVFLVNLSYPEWSGGWSTGPRLLVPMIPFAMVPVAAILSLNSRFWTIAAVSLGLIGGAEMLLFQAAGGRIPNHPDQMKGDSALLRPLREVVWPLWKGDPVPRWREGARFDRTIVGNRWPESFRSLPPGWRWLEFGPLIGGQILAIGMALLVCKRGEKAEKPASKAESFLPGEVHGVLGGP